MSGRDALRPERPQTLRSLSDLKEVQITPKPRPFSMWNPESMAIDILGQATVTLSDWLHARLGDLVSERVPLEDVAVVHQGGRTIIKVAGKARFEFKLKVQMEGK